MVQKHILQQALRELGVEDRLQNENVLSVAELGVLLAKIFVRLNHVGLDHSVVEECTELTLNWVLRCCDRYRNTYSCLFLFHVSFVVCHAAHYYNSYSYLMQGANWWCENKVPKG